jgi:hypothetical protein
MAVELSALRRRPPFTPGKIHGTHFCQTLSRHQDNSAAGRIRAIDKSNDQTGNLTRDLPACSIVLQPTTLPRAPHGVSHSFFHKPFEDNRRSHLLTPDSYLGGDRFEYRTKYRLTSHIFSEFPRSTQANARSRDSSVGIATGLVGRGSTLGREGVRDFSLFNSVQTGSGVHPAYPMGTGGLFPDDKATRVCSWLLTSI